MRILLPITLLAFAPAAALAQKNEKGTGAYPQSRHTSVGVKTNLLYWGTTSPNAALEFGLAPKWTLEVGVGWNPWVWKNGMSLRHWMVQPEARYWFCRRFEGHFLGAHGIYGRFNVGNLNFGPQSVQDYMYKGYGYGGGIAYGYHFPLGRRWGLELTAGIGYVRLHYDKYLCEECVSMVGSYKRDYFGPTKLGVNLIFMIN